jgi:hypothetical protein
MQAFKSIHPFYHHLFGLNKSGVIEPVNNEPIAFDIGFFCLPICGIYG